MGESGTDDKEDMDDAGDDRMEDSLPVSIGSRCATTSCAIGKNCPPSTHDKESKETNAVDSLCGNKLSVSSFEEFRKTRPSKDEVGSSADGGGKFSSSPNTYKDFKIRWKNSFQFTIRKGEETYPCAFSTMPFPFWRLAII
jgi:hypothetical protein